MIVFLDKYRNLKVARVAKRGIRLERSRYLDRSSYEEAMLSDRWTQAERLMQMLDVSWNEANRIIGQSRDKRVRGLSAQ